MHTHSESFRIFLQFQRLPAPQQGGASKPDLGEPRKFRQGAAQPEKKITFSYVKYVNGKLQVKIMGGEGCSGRSGRGRKRDVMCEVTWSHAPS